MRSGGLKSGPVLLRVLELSGCIVTLDAMGCQKKIAKEIIEADADCVCPEVRPGVRTLQGRKSGR